MARERKAIRSEISQMFEKAEDLRDWPGSYFPALSRAKKALAEWRVEYPGAALEEDRGRLIAEAEHLERLAQGALSFTADGWLDAPAREQRAAKMRSEAVELREQAAKLSLAVRP